MTAVIVVLVAQPLYGGSALETIDITGAVPSPVPGEVIGNVVPMRWDARCVPVHFRLNDTQDPIPNPIGDDFLSVGDAQSVLETAMASWNDIRTSYIELDFDGTTSNPGFAGFDMVNEQTFRFPPELNTPGATTAVTVLTALIQDSTLADGDDLDGDGDSDVSSAIGTCTDDDGDGDTEFPAGFYRAGTILEADVQYNTVRFRFTLAEEDADTDTFSVDLEGAAVHEMGHAHGLSHSSINQLSSADGTGVTMFEDIDVSDPANELAQRSLEADDLATSSLFYPEGTAGYGPAALSPGDVPFRHAYGLIRGEATHGATGRPLAGAAVEASRFFHGDSITAAITGSTRVSFDPSAGTTSFVDPDFAIVDGRYTLAVPFGLYAIRIEALDGSPLVAVPTNPPVNLTFSIGTAFGQQDFNEEFYNRHRERAVERASGEARPTLRFPGFNRSGIDLITNVDTEIKSFGSIDFLGFTAAAGDSYLAVAFPAADITAADRGRGLAFHAGLFRTVLWDISVVSQWGDAVLTTCEVSGGTATVDLAHPLRRQPAFVGQDNDFAPFYFDRPVQLGRRILRDIARGEISHLCLVLQLRPEPFPGPVAFPPLIGLDGSIPNDVPIAGLSLSSADGVTFTVSNNFNFPFSLVVSDPY